MLSLIQIGQQIERNQFTFRYRSFLLCDSIQYYIDSAEQYGVIPWISEHFVPLSLKRAVLQYDYTDSSTINVHLCSHSNNDCGSYGKVENPTSLTWLSMRKQGHSYVSNENEACTLRTGQTEAGDDSFIE